MNAALILACALILDAIFGEPKSLWNRIPHPAVLMGRLIDYVEIHTNRGENRKTKGVIAFGLLALGAVFLGLTLSMLPFGWLIEIACVMVLLAQRSLADHVSAVAQTLRLSTGGGRMAVAKIVGRDTRELDDAQISRAAIESAAENLSDGVVAPAFWFLTLGLPGLFLYKMTNTADSMIGYKTPRFQNFGWPAARFDDLLNYLPARLTALLILIGCGTLRHHEILRQDAPMHRSPNAGWPEAAMAVSLDIALSGPRSYDGDTRDYPFVNSNGNKAIGPNEIDAAVSVLWRVWGICLVISLALALL